MTHIRKFIWDLTYACPLRCKHCYSESGRRAPRMLGNDDAMRVVDVMLAAGGEVVSISGGEPLSAKWCVAAMKRLHDAGVDVTLFTSGYVMSEVLAIALCDSVSRIAVSIDGARSAIHDSIRGRVGAFDTAMNALQMLYRTQQQRRSAERDSYKLGIDYTLTRSGAVEGDLEQFVDRVVDLFPDLDFIRFGAVIPSGLAAERSFEREEMLDLDMLNGLAALRDRLAARVPRDMSIAMTDIRYFLPTAESLAGDLDILQIEPDGNLRAYPIYEAKVGNVLEEPLAILWERVLAWRSDAFVVDQMTGIRDMADWARVTRTLDRRYGSMDDQARIAARLHPAGQQRA